MSHVLVYAYIDSERKVINQFHPYIQAISFHLCNTSFILVLTIEIYRHIAIIIFSKEKNTEMYSLIIGDIIST